MPRGRKSSFKYYWNWYPNWNDITHMNSLLINLDSSIYLTDPESDSQRELNWLLGTLYSNASKWCRKQSDLKKKVSRRTNETVVVLQKWNILSGFILPQSQVMNRQ